MQSRRFHTQRNKIEGVIDQNGNTILGQSVILATGHSARDIFYLLNNKNLLIEAKSFAMGVRIEHPQPIIDSAQYHCDIRSRYLPAASYKFVQQVNGKGVFSFCMCPGGHIVPSATTPGEVVVNGMSASTRSSRYANSGMVVAIEAEDLKAYKQHGALAGLVFQQEMEKMAWEAGGKTQAAPAQRMVDFANGKFSNTLNDCSYIPGVNSAPLHELLPSIIGNRLQKGFKAFGRKMKGYYTNEANVLGVESRTSSPVRIPRDTELLNHPQIVNLYPCGEGADMPGVLFLLLLMVNAVLRQLKIRFTDFLKVNLKPSFVSIPLSIGRIEHFIHIGSLFENICFQNVSLDSSSIHKIRSAICRAVAQSWVLIIMDLLRLYRDSSTEQTIPSYEPNPKKAVGSSNSKISVS